MIEQTIRPQGVQDIFSLRTSYLPTINIRSKTDFSLSVKVYNLVGAICSEL